MPHAIQPHASPNATFAPLVVDARADDDIKRFRALDGDVRISGSAQFSLRGWESVLRWVGESARERGDVSSPEVYVVDLREESHAFVGASAVSWYAHMNWGSAGLSAQDAANLERIRRTLLELSDEIVVTTSDALKAGLDTREVWPAASVRSEHDALGLAGGQYVRLPVSDHAAPRDLVVDAFVSFVRALREQGGSHHVHFHCRGGKGRTTLFMAMHELLMTPGLAYEAIVEKHRSVSGYDLARVPGPEKREKAPFVTARVRFLELFASYAKSDGRTRWSDWLSCVTDNPPC